MTADGKLVLFLRAANRAANRAWGLESELFASTPRVSFDIGALGLLEDPVAQPKISIM